MPTAHVLTVSYVSLPDNGEDAWEVRTDLSDKVNSAFYLAHDAPKPVEGALVTWDSRHAMWLVDEREMVVRKLGYSHDPDRALT